MIFRQSSKFPINNWTNKGKDDVAFIIGNGPSLLDNNLKLLDGVFSIGINRAYKVILPTILMWQDESLYEDCYEDLKFLPCAKLTTSTIDKDDIFTHYSIVSGNFRFPKTPGKLYGGGCTAILSMQLAFAMGFSSIVLLGIDCKYRNDQTDFYGSNKYHTDLTLRNFLGAMEWASRECPIPVLNCGDVPYWPKIRLEEAITKTNPKKEYHLIRLGKLL